MINRTAIEEWIFEKSSCREAEKPFTFPYNLGWKQNLLEVNDLSIIIITSRVMLFI